MLRERLLAIKHTLVFISGKIHVTTTQQTSDQNRVPQFEYQISSHDKSKRQTFVFLPKKLINNIIKPRNLCSLLYILNFENWLSLILQIFKISPRHDIIHAWPRAVAEYDHHLTVQCM